MTAINIPTGATLLGNKKESSSSDERKKTEFWVNIGVPSGKFDENGQEYLIKLNVAASLDNVKLHNANGSATISQLRQAEDALYQALMAEAQKMKPGETSRIPSLVVELRRADVPVAAEDNEFTAVIANILK